jgi:hypothetical protein
MGINRLQRQRLFQDEELFNKLLPFARYDQENSIFVHTDASLWSIWELQPKWITKVSDAEAFQLCERVQEMLDSLDHNFSAQFCWVAKRWIRSIRLASQSRSLHRRPRKLRLYACFRYDPPWEGKGFGAQLARTMKMFFYGAVGLSAEQRYAEYMGFANKFKGIMDGTAAKLADLGFYPRRVDGQGLINLLYPILNRRSVKPGKHRRGRGTAIPVPEYDPHDLLGNQISETHVEHPRDGIIRKDGRVFRSVSMVKPPKTCMPLMIAPLQSAPYENILSVTFSKEPKERQLERLDRLDGTLGMRERSWGGRSNQKVLHQISAIRQARQELYNAREQIVEVGVHQTFICQNDDEAVRATSEAVASFPQLNGARGMLHEISDMAVLINSLPGAYDPSTDGAGWTTTVQSSRAVRMFPLWGNWRGSAGSQILLPSLWNRTQCTHQRSIRCR